jgi:hypothetical protein
MGAAGEQAPEYLYLHDHFGRRDRVYCDIAIFRLSLLSLAFFSRGRLRQSAHVGRATSPAHYYRADPAAAMSGITRGVKALKRTLNADTRKRAWHYINAEDMIVGRLASSIVPLITGKWRPDYSPSQDSGDYVVVRCGGDTLVGCCSRVWCGHGPCSWRWSARRVVELACCARLFAFPRLLTSSPGNNNGAECDNRSSTRRSSNSPRTRCRRRRTTGTPATWAGSRRRRPISSSRRARTARFWRGQCEA